MKLFDFPFGSSDKKCAYVTSDMPPERAFNFAIVREDSRGTSTSSKHDIKMNLHLIVWDRRRKSLPPLNEPHRN
jgi:hypothetical protein